MPVNMSLKVSFLVEAFPTVCACVHLNLRMGSHVICQVG